jgi:hypothetical protein
LIIKYCNTEEVASESGSGLLAESGTVSRAGICKPKRWRTWKNEAAQKENRVEGKKETKEKDRKTH